MAVRGGLELGEMKSDRILSGSVEYATLVPGGELTSETPLLLWLHGGGGSHRFLETCHRQFMECWADKTLPSMVVATPSAGWSFYLDRHDGTDLWETFLLEEFIPEIQSKMGISKGAVLIGGISAGGLGALRLGFKRPDVFTSILAIEPTLEASLTWDRAPLRDQVYMTASQRAKLFGDPLDHRFWKANHPTSIAIANSTLIAAAKPSIFIEAGDQDLFHVHHGTELLHRCLFDIGISHEYRLTAGGNHLGPSVGPRIVDALRFLGRELWSTYHPDSSIDSMIEMRNVSEQIRSLEGQSGYRSVQSFSGPAGSLKVHTQGEGQAVVLLPSLGRPASDFANLSDRLAEAGYRVLAPEPRGSSGSSMALANLTLFDFAEDVAAVIRADNQSEVCIVGHDFGGHVARATASQYPELVKNMVLLATAGPLPAKSEPATALRRTFISELSMEERLEAISVAYFAEGNDPVVWVDGWNEILASAQLEALQRTPSDEWCGGGDASTLLVRPTDDVLVSSDSARSLANELNGQVFAVEIPNAGHALLPEQPEAVAVAVLTWLRRNG